MRASVDRVVYAYLTGGRVAIPSPEDVVPVDGAPTAEGIFFDNPAHRGVREFAESNAISNNPEIAGDAAIQDHMDETPASAEAQARTAPPTPTEIADEPGGDQLSTLNQYVVQTEEPVPGSVPQHHHEVPKHPVLASWEDAALLRYLGELKAP